MSPFQFQSSEAARKNIAGCDGCRLPLLKPCRSANFWRSFALSPLLRFGVSALALRLAEINLDLLGLRLSLLDQPDLQHTLIVFCSNRLMIHGLWQGKGPPKASITVLYTPIVVGLLLALELAFAGNAQRVVLQLDVDIFLVNACNIQLQRDAVFVLVDIHGRRESCLRLLPPRGFLLRQVVQPPLEVR